jgi:hypothetical protein
MDLWQRYHALKLCLSGHSPFWCIIRVREATLSTDDAIEAIRRLLLGYHVVSLLTINAIDLGMTSKRCLACSLCSAQVDGIW